MVHAPEEQHIASLDGIRGCAVLLVLVFHGLMFQGTPPHGLLDTVYFDIFGLGWCGVDLFFVLSGFLITGLLLKARDHSRYFSNFYARRFLRIFPAYFLFIILVFFLLRPLFDGFDYLDKTKQHLLWFILYVQNWFPVFNHGDFDISFRMTRHLWSLAIEEQFYLIWPLVVFLVPKQKLARLCLIVFVVVIAARCVAIEAGVSRHSIYRCTFFRLDGLMAGGFLAALSIVKVQSFLKRSWWIGAAALGCLLGVCFSTEGFGPAEYGMQSLGFSCLAVMFLVLIAHAAFNPKGFIAGAMETRTLTFFGKYSYAMYIFHVPVMVSLHHVWRPVGLSSMVISHILFTIISISGTLLISLASWHFIENRCLALKRYFL